MSAMTLISTVTVGSGGASQILFSSIPATFTDLLLVSSMRSASPDEEDGFVQFNGDTSGNYSFRRLFGVGSGGGISDSFGGTGTMGRVTRIASSNFTANTFSNSQLYLPNYRSNNVKSISADTVSENNATQAGQFIYATLYSGTAAITSIRLAVLSGANFVQHTSASLYGITAGSSGGVIVS